MGTWRRMFGRDEGESPEQYMRRLAANSTSSGYVRPVLPSIVELYDRTAWLHDRVVELESRVQQLEKGGQPSP